MTLFFADLVRVACHASGAGSLALGEPLPGHRGFDLVPPGARFHYAVLGVTHPEEWETGEGALEDGALLRTSLASSAGGAAVDFSPGLKTVALTVAATWFADQAGALAGKADLAGAAFIGPVSVSLLSLGNDLAIGDGGTGASSAAAARSNLGLGSLATQASNAVAISGGAIAGLNTLGVAGNVTLTGGSIQLDNAQYCWGKIAAGTATRILGINAANTCFIGSIDAPIGSVVIAGAGATWATFSTSGLNVPSGFAYKVNNVQVVGSRKTGWTAATGTADRTAFATYSAPTIGNPPTQAEVQAIANAVQMQSRHLKALIDDLIGHGLIGSA